jgi:uncharacterized protein DUF6790
MYLGAIILLMLVLPAASVAVEALRQPGAADLMLLIGKWLTFWAVGVRLFSAGVMQSFRPQFTAESIFDLNDQDALGIVREVGFGNLAMGALGLASLIKPEWIVPAAIVGGLYYGLAGLGHLLRKTRNFKEQTALVSDLAIFVLLAAFVASRAL